MEQRNLLLAFALSLAVLMFWSAWVEQTRPPGKRGAAPSQVEQASGAKPPQAEAATPVPDLSPVPQQQPQVWKQRAEERVRLENALVRAELTSHGAGLARWELREFTTQEGGQARAVELSWYQESGAPALATPLLELGLGDLSKAPFALVESGLRYADFELTAAGVKVRKRFELAEDDYLLRVHLEVSNDGERGVAPRFALLWTAGLRGGPDYATTSLVAYQEGEVETVDLRGFGQPGFFGSLTGRPPERSRELVGEIEWAGVQTNYFLAAVLPDAPRDARVSFEALDPGRRASASVGYAPITIPAGHAAGREYRAYLGPKQPERLQAVGSNLDQSISLGWSWIAPLTRLFIWLLDVCYAVVPNYGLAIILLTVMVRLVTAPLLAKQMRSMKRLGEIQPQLKAIQEKYADDRQRQSQEVMKLMRQAGANPLGGCLPMLFQFPFLIGLFWALQSSIELRQAPFFGWIQDLSAPETLFTIPGIELPVRVLPLVMGGSMVLQQRMSPSTMDPAQARMMMIVMPLMLTLISYQFPSGLVLYWFVSNILAIGHQMLMNRQQK